MQNGKIRITYATPTKTETQQILKGLTAYIPKKTASKFLKGYHILLAKGRRVEVYLLSSAVWELYQQTHPHRYPYFLGLFLGELTQGSLQPSLHVLAYLTEQGNDSIKVVATKKGAQRFLYGQQLESQHFTHLPKDVNGATKLLVINEHNEGLGYAQLKLTPKGKPQIKNQGDLGWYLRRGH